MKKLLMLTLMLASWYANAQDTLKVYLDKDGKQTKKLEKAFSQRKVFLTKEGLYSVQEFDMSGHLTMTGTYKEKGPAIRHGLFTWYHVDGAKQKTIFYVDDLPVGDSYAYYESGKIDGHWEYDSLGNLQKEEFFKEDGTESVFTKPEYNGGFAKMYMYLAQNIRYPVSAMKNRAQGKVFVSFSVCTDGSLCDFKVVNRIDSDLAREAVRVVSKMPNWIPGERDGQKAKVKFVLPVNFAIE